jgi:hypothetical protein
LGHLPAHRLKAPGERTSDFGCAVTGGPEDGALLRGEAVKRTDQQAVTTQVNFDASRGASQQDPGGW